MLSKINNMFVKVMENIDKKVDVKLDDNSAKRLGLERFSKPNLISAKTCISIKMRIA